VDKTACTAYCGDGAVNGNELCDGAAQGGTCGDLGARGGRLGCDAFCRSTFDSCFWGDWRQVTVPTIAPLHAVWAPAWDDVWLLGDGDQGGAILRFDGFRWTRRDVPVVGATSVWASGPDDIWLAGGRAVGSPVRLQHFDGRRWSDAPVDGARAVWGTRRDD